MLKKFHILGLLILGISLIFTGFFLGKSLNSRNTNFSVSSLPSSSLQVLGEKTRIQGKVVKVIDGDTIQVESNGKTSTVRLIGIDTPETVDPRKTIQCFGAEASNKAREILTVGRKIFLESDQVSGDKDKYGRLLRYIFLEDGTNFNRFMIGEGFAHEYTYKSEMYSYRNEFKIAEESARENKKSLWKDNVCTDSITGAHVQTSQLKDTGKYACDCSKLCSSISSCEEAYFQLKECGCSKRDADGDGIPCESLCR